MRTGIGGGKRTFVFALLVGAAMIMLPQLASAVDFVAVVPDGRTVQRNISSADRVGFFFSVQAGRSYSVTVVTDDNFTGLTAGFSDSAGGTCDDVDDAFVVRHETTEPRIAFGAGRGVRASFIAPATQAFVACVTSSSAGVNPIFATVSETTIVNPAWSTFGTFETFYSLANTTNVPLNATLKIFNTAGAEVGSFNFNGIPAGGTLSTNTGALAVANNLNGSATIVHDGPPGAIICEAAIADFATAPRVIQPVTCTAVREAAH